MEVAAEAHIDGLVLQFLHIGVSLLFFPLREWLVRFLKKQQKNVIHEFLSINKSILQKST
jgi:hypothetical protein